MSEIISHSAPVRRHRSLFLSDLHLGAIGSRADLILHFLEQNKADTYVLVGDVIDTEVPFLPRRASASDDVVDHLRRRRSEGAKLIYLVGNHDPEPSAVSERRRLPVDPVEEYLHRTADGRSYLVIHGHQQDRAFIRSHLLTRLGTYIEGVARLICAAVVPEADYRLHSRRVDRLFAAANAALHLGRSHERRLVELARERGVDGVICGHYHLADVHDQHGLVYANCGDWVTSITCLAEDYSGKLRLLDGHTAPVFSSDLSREPQAVRA